MLPTLRSKERALGRSLNDIACRGTGESTGDQPRDVVSGTTDKDRSREGGQRVRAPE